MPALIPAACALILEAGAFFFFYLEHSHGLRYRVQKLEVFINRYGRNRDEAFWVFGPHFQWKYDDAATTHHQKIVV